MFLINDLNLGLSLFQGQTQENKIVVSKLIGRFTVKGCFCWWYELWSKLSCSHYFQSFLSFNFILLVNDTNFSVFFPPTFLDRVKSLYFLCFILFFQKLP